MKQNAENVSPMSNERRKAYVVRQITNALLMLLREKAIEDISISELCGRACVGRASFYRNYDSKEDILREYITGLCREWSVPLSEGGDVPLSEQIRRIFAHFEAHRDIYSLLNERGLVYLLKDVVIGMIGPRPGCPKVEAYAAAFVSYTIYGWIEVWFGRGMQESSDEMADMFKAQGL